MAGNGVDGRVLVCLAQGPGFGIEILKNYRGGTEREKNLRFLCLWQKSESILESIRQRGETRMGLLLRNGPAEFDPRLLPGTRFLWFHVRSQLLRIAAYCFCPDGLS